MLTKRMRKQPLLHLVSGSVNWHALNEWQFGSVFSNYSHTLDPAIALSGNCASNTLTDAHKDIRTWNLYRAFLPKKDHICVLEVIKMFNNGHRFKPLQYIKITKYYGTIENAKVALYVILWNNLQNILISLKARFRRVCTA